MRVHLSSHWPPHAAAVCLALDQQLTGATKSTGRASSGQDSVWHAARGTWRMARGPWQAKVSSLSLGNPLAENFLFTA